jgi:hypothetical protein
MSSFLTASSINHKYTRYLSACDLLNKYNFKNINELPKLKKVVLEFSSFDILSSYEIGNKQEWDSELQLKSFLLLYLLQSNKPFVNLNKVQAVRDINNFSVKAILSSEKEIQLFLSSIFVENWNTLVLDDFLLFKGSIAKYNRYLQRNNVFVLNTKIPVSSFFELNTFLTKNLFNISSKNLNIKVSFVFFNKLNKNKNVSLKLIKNLPLFWVCNNIGSL